jgi:hypothetical protein
MVSGLYPENTQYKKGLEAVAQVVEYLPSPCEVLSSNSSILRKRVQLG